MKTRKRDDGIDGCSKSKFTLKRQFKLIPAVSHDDNYKCFSSFQGKHSKG